MLTPLEDDSSRILKRLDDIETVVQGIRLMLDALTTMLVDIEVDEDPDPAAMTLDGPIENATRDPNQPL